MPYITVGAENTAPIDLYYEDHGSGPPVVLIHGFPLASAAWEKQVPALLGAGYRTIAYDRRGFGKSSHTAGGYDYDTFAGDLDVIMNELDLFNAVLIGHSMGTGEITRYLSLYGSARVSMAVLISALPPFLLQTPDNPQGVESSVLEGFMHQIVTDRPRYQTAFLNDFFNYEQTKGTLVSEDAYRANWNLAVSASAIGTLACVAAWQTDFRPDLARIDTPVLIVHGDADRVLPHPATAAALQPALPGSQLITLVGAPHSIPWTHAEDVNAAILEFIGMPVMAMAATA
jgi:non-heme chloroperoxidase